MTVKIDGTNTVANPAFTGADTDTGLQCGTNEVNLVTGGTARAKVDSSGNVNIGVNSSTNPFAYLRFGASQYGAADIRPTDEGSHKVGLSFYTDGTSDTTVNPTERMRILSDGTIRLASGCPGIDFSQIQTNVSGMSSETLDSYEEGTWTPTTYSNDLTFNSATYVKVGRMVTAHCSLTGVTSYTASTGNPFWIFGFPFTTASGGTNNTATSATGSCKLTSMNSSITTGTLSVVMDKNNTRCRIQKNATNASDSFISLQEVGTGSFGIVVNVTYYTT